MNVVLDLERRGKQLRALRGLVEEGIDLLVSGADLRSFGELLHESWMVKRRLSDQASALCRSDPIRSCHGSLVCARPCHATKRAAGPR